jgi:hypothetical protein
MTEENKELEELAIITNEQIEEGNSAFFHGASHETMTHLPINMGAIYGFPVVNMDRLVNHLKNHELDTLIQNYLESNNEGMIVRLAYHSKLLPNNHRPNDTKAVFRALKEAYLDQDRQLYIFDNPQSPGLDKAVIGVRHPLHGQINVVNYKLPDLLCATGSCQIK